MEDRGPSFYINFIFFIGIENDDRKILFPRQFWCPMLKALWSFQFKINKFEFLRDKNHQQKHRSTIQHPKKVMWFKSLRITLARVWWTSTFLCCVVRSSAALHIRMFTYFVDFNLQLKLCCVNVNENTMNQTENHYHFNSLYFGPSLSESLSLSAEFSLRSAFFAEENFATVFSTHLFGGIFCGAVRLILC